MYDKELVLDIISQMEETLQTVIHRTERIRSVDDFLRSDSGMILLDSVCMKLVAVGESLKNIDKITHNSLLVKYDGVNWKDIKGMRDVIVHHYFEIDADIVYRTLSHDVPVLLSIFGVMRSDLSSQ